MATTDASESKEFQKFLDGSQYTRVGVLRYEQVFGAGFVSTGGETTTRDFLPRMGLKAGDKVLDVGCGIGGGDFLMAKEYGTSVLGLDLSRNMLDIARERAALPENAGLDVTFVEEDITASAYEDGQFDVIYSRDTLLHIADKPGLFVKFFKWLKPGGRILISDYCRGATSHADPAVQTEFDEYVKGRGYVLLTVEAYGKALSDAGFADVRADDVTDMFVDCLKREVGLLRDSRESFCKDFSVEDYDYLVSGWEAKVVRCGAGLQKWGLFQCVKPEASATA